MSTQAIARTPAAAPGPTASVARRAARRPGAPGAEADALAWVPTGLVIGGRPAHGRAGLRMPVEDPATGRVLTMVADAREADCLDALGAAAATQDAWARVSPRDRSRVLRRAADGLRARRDLLALVATLEMGRPLPESAAEVEFAADYLEWFAEEAVRIEGREVLLPGGSARATVRRTPVGPCLVVAPWNFPLAVPARGIAPALAAGCTVVLRPSALTPLSGLALARVLMEAGLPEGVLSVVASSRDDATDALLSDRRLRKLTFTGSAPVGRRLAALAADGGVRTAMELGGCAPFVVLDDADLDLAVEAAVQAKARNGGAACTAANRFYVARPIAREFTRRLAARMAGLRMGRGTAAGTGLGPMIAERHVERLEGLVEDAVARGARTALPGGRVAGPGHFFAPVVLADVPRDARVMREEIFGPIAPVRAFDREEEAVEMANDSAHGLAAYVCGRDLGRALRVAGAIDAGMTAVNAGRVSDAALPFGGVHASGTGRAGGREGIDEYLDTRYVLVPEEGR